VVFYRIVSKGCIFLKIDTCTPRNVDLVCDHAVLARIVEHDPKLHIPNHVAVCQISFGKVIEVDPVRPSLLRWSLEISYEVLVNHTPLGSLATRINGSAVIQSLTEISNNISFDIVIPPGEVDSIVTDILDQIPPQDDMIHITRKDPVPQGRIPRIHTYRIVHEGQQNQRIQTYMFYLRRIHREIMSGKADASIFGPRDMATPDLEI